MSVVKTRARAIIKAGKHNWLENDYIVAIYMALHSPKDYKVGLFNLDQCAFYIGVSSNAMKMMADNFKAFLGKAKLGISCPKMVEAFAKYKNVPKEELAKIASDYVEAMWNYQRRRIDVERYVNSIGKEAFVDYYEFFKSASLDSDNQEKYVDGLPEKWNKKGRKMRVSYTNMLFKCKRDKEALELIVKSKGVSPETREKATKLLNQ